jgi:hypothetical protein
LRPAGVTLSFNANRVKKELRMKQIGLRRFAYWQSACAVSLALAVASCGGGGPAPVADPLPAAPGSWQVFFPTSATVDGRTIKPTCSKAPSTNPQFRFWARRGPVNKLVVYFEGGGACWDSATCALPAYLGMPPNAPFLYKGEVLPTDNPTAYGGMFDLANANNPVKDWGFVYVPYCTGDIHAGSNTASYVNPFNGQTYQIEHRGADNFRVVLEWMRANFPAPEQILVTGSSAGGYGALLNYPLIRRNYAMARTMVLADAAQGVTPASFDSLRNANWNIQLDPLVYGTNPQSTPTSELTRRLALAYSGDTVAQYTTSLDLVQMQFYDVMVNGLTGVQGTACQAWTDQMVAGLALNQTAPNFRSYMAAGTTHTLLRGNTTNAQGQPLYYAEASAGVPFLTWLGGLLSGAPVQNVACTNCTTFPPGQCPF